MTVNPIDHLIEKVSECVKTGLFQSEDDAINALIAYRNAEQIGQVKEKLREAEMSGPPIPFSQIIDNLDRDFIARFGVSRQCCT